MRSARIGQAAILIFIVVVAVSCAATKEYTSKIFPTRVPDMKDSQAVALRFLDIDSTDQTGENWVSTDFIMGRDTLSKTLALDKLSRVFPANGGTSKTTDSTNQSNTSSNPVLVTKPVPAESEPVARYINPGEVRTKRTRE